MEFSEKRKKIIDRIVKTLNIADPSKKNSLRYQKLLSAMTDKQFHKFMKDLKENKQVLYINTHNMHSSPLSPDNLIAAAEYLKLQVMQHIWMTDKATGVRMKTPEKYLVLEEYVRRAQQYHDKKIAVPLNDKKVDMLSGQVTGESRSLNITGPEMLILVQRGLPNTALELIKVRGGDVAAYDEFSRSCYETGGASLDSLAPDTRAKSSLVSQLYLKGMMLDSNFVD